MESSSTTTPKARNASAASALASLKKFSKTHLIPPTPGSTTATSSSASSSSGHQRLSSPLIASSSRPSPLAAASPLGSSGGRLTGLKRTFSAKQASTRQEHSYLSTPEEAYGHAQVRTKPLSPPTLQDIANGRHNQQTPAPSSSNPRGSTSTESRPPTSRSPYARRLSPSAASSVSSVTSSGYNPAAVPLRSSLKKTSTKSSDNNSVAGFPASSPTSITSGPGGASAVNSRPGLLPGTRTPMSARSSLTTNHPKATAAVKNLFSGLHGHRKNLSRGLNGIFEPETTRSLSGLGSSSPANGDAGSLYSELSSHGTAMSRKRTIGRVRFSDDEDDEVQVAIVGPMTTSSSRPSADRQRTMSAPALPSIPSSFTTSSSRTVAPPPLPTADSAATIRPDSLPSALLTPTLSNMAPNPTQMFLNSKRTVIKIIHRVTNSNSSNGGNSDSLNN